MSRSLCMKINAKNIIKKDKKWHDKTMKFANKYLKICELYKNKQNIYRKEFQDIYKDFYGINLYRKNVSGWSKKYFDLMFLNYGVKGVSFSQLYVELYNKTKIKEHSFASKMLHTINNNNPIWDSHVQNSLTKLGCDFSKSNGLDADIYNYHIICKWMKKYLKTEECKNNIKAFDLLLPELKGIHRIKKIDFLLYWMDKR